MKTLIKANQAWQMRLSLDGLSVEPDAALQCHAVVQAKQLGSGEHFLIAQKTIALEGIAPYKLMLDAAALPPGLYRLEAGVQVTSRASNSAPLASWAEGALVRVY